MEQENVDIDEVLNIVNETKILIIEDRYKKDSIEELQKDYPDENEKVIEVLLNYMGENDPKKLKTEFADKWNYLGKKATSLCKHFITIDDYQKPVNNLQKGEFLSK